jgi:BolA family transcriptional regulator, general stress-responsive regulator
MRTERAGLQVLTKRIAPYRACGIGAARRLDRVMAGWKKCPERDDFSANLSSGSTSLVEHDLFPKTGIHFSGSCSKLRCLMTVRATIAEKLTQAFAPVALEVVDQSHLHAGHAGARPGGETHFAIDIVSAAFRGKSRLERHRMINDALAGELKTRVHALAIRAATPEEAS